MSDENPVIDDLDGDPDSLVGTVLLDRYKIDRRLGEGGMGAVYAARHTVLDKICAIKVLHDEYSRRDELVERFLHEARAASKIRHEHVIDVFDFGQTKKKNVFFAMEYLEGRDLADEIRLNGPLSWPRTKSIILQICAALQAAHEANIIHRDLKPENVFLIARRGNPDFVKLLDFGIAKVTEVPEGAKRLTRTGMVFGTPEYMSPEQARGDRPDARVNVYACGCILFEMLTGNVPFIGDNFMGTLTRQIFDPVPRISERTARDDLPSGIQAVIDQALAKDRELRITNMSELAVAIDTLDDVPGVGYRAAATPAPVLSGSRPAVIGAPPRPAPPPASAPRPAAETSEGRRYDTPSVAARAASAAARAAGEAARAAHEVAKIARIASERPGSRADRDPGGIGGIGRANTIEQEGVEAVRARDDSFPARERRTGLWVGAAVVLVLAVGGVIYAMRGGGTKATQAPAVLPAETTGTERPATDVKPAEVPPAVPETQPAADTQPGAGESRQRPPRHHDRNVATDTKPAVTNTKPDQGATIDSKPAATDVKPPAADTKPATTDGKPAQDGTTEKPGSDLKNPYPRRPK